MAGHDRRGFLQWLAGGLLCLLPASLRAQTPTRQAAPEGTKTRRLAKPIDDDFSRTLKSSTKANHVRVLKTAKLAPEEKLAVAAARELGPRELESTAAKLRGSKDLGSDTGFICGGGCGGGGGDTGVICGASCPGMLGKGEAVIDPQGLLKLNIKDLNKAVALQAIDRAIAIDKQLATGR